MRILGINIPENKRLDVGLAILYGVGRPLAEQVLDKAKVDRSKKPKDLTADEEAAIRSLIEVMPLRL